MRCPYCQQNIRVQGRFCPKCGEQIFGLPVRPQGQQPAATPPVTPTPDVGPAAPTPPAPPPYQPFGQPQAHQDYDDGLGIEVETEPEPAASTPSAGAAHTGRPGVAHAAARDEIGKTCPYCRFPLKPDEQVITCPACKLPHHADCWGENRGCTTYGCRGAAGATPAAATPGVPSTLSPGAPMGAHGGQLPGLDYLRTNELAARAQNALYLALIGLFCLCLPVGIVGMFMAMAVLRDCGPAGMRGGEARGKATAAIVIGIVAIIAWVTYFVIQMANR